MAQEEIEHLKAPSLSRLLAMGLPAMASEAAPYVCLVLQTAMLYRAKHLASSTTRVVADFAAVTSCLDFLTGLFNFLFMVVLANVGRAVGKRDWKTIERRVRLALSVAIFLGLTMALFAACLQRPVFQLMRISQGSEEKDGSDGNHDPTGVRTFYFLRCAAMPAVLMLKVSLGALGGYQRLDALTALNVGRSALEAGMTNAFLFPLSSSISFVSDVGALGALGLVTLTCAYFSAAVGVVLIWALNPFRRVAAVDKSNKVEQPTLNKTADEADPGCELDNECDHEEEDDYEFGVWQFFRDSRDTMVRSLCLQGSVWALAVSAASLGTSSLAAHQVLLLLWLITSYVVDGFADVGSMVGSRLLGARQFGEFRVLTGRLSFLGLCVGVTAAVGFVSARDDVIALFLGHHSNGRDDADDDDDDREETASILRQCWTLFCVCQVTNSIVFTYDGLLIAAEQFAFNRNTFLLGTFGLFLPALLTAVAGPPSLGCRSLLAVWFAKALLNWWRAAVGVGRIAVWLPRSKEWKLLPPPTKSGKGAVSGEGSECGPDRSHTAATAAGHIGVETPPGALEEGGRGGGHSGEDEVGGGKREASDLLREPLLTTALRE